MKNHFIGTNVHSVQDVISNNAAISHGVVLFLDFCKAFDSINHLFMMSLLLHIGLPPEFISWIMILYSGATSCVHYNNWLTKPFHLGRGV